MSRWCLAALLIMGPGLAQQSAQAPPPSAQQPADAPSPSAQQLYNEAKQQELGGDMEGAYAQYGLVVDRFPNSEWAELAAERRAPLAARISYQKQAVRAQPLGLLFGLLFALVQIGFWLVVLGGIFGFVGWRLGWFWEWALLAAIAERLNLAVGRVQGRKRLARELHARKANPRDARARYALGVMYYQQGRYAPAAEELEASVALNADRTDAQYHLGLAYLRLGRPNDAIAPLEKVAASRPDLGGDALVRLAEVRLAMGDPAEAERLCRQSVEMWRGDAESRYCLALALDAQGRTDEATEALHQAIALGRAYRGSRRREVMGAVRRAKAYLRRRPPRPSA